MNDDVPSPVSKLTLKEYMRHFSLPDDRTGSGYSHTGKATGTGGTYTTQSAYPYTDEDEYASDEEEEEEEDEGELDKFVKKINLQHQTPDSLRVKSIDNRSFASTGNRIDLAAGYAMKGISPIPNLYSNRGATTGGISPQVNRIRPGMKGGVGSKKGFSSAPPPPKDDSSRRIFNLTDLLDSDDETFEEWMWWFTRDDSERE